MSSTRIFHSGRGALTAWLIVVTSSLLVPPGPARGAELRELSLPMPAPEFVHQSNAGSYDSQGFFGQDALFDDQGADANPGDSYSVLTGFEGDAFLPGTQTNVGDIRSVRVRPVPGDVSAVDISVTMNSRHLTLKDASGEVTTSTLHQVAFIGVDDGGGGFGAWPHGAGLTTPGIDRGFTLTFDDFATVTTGAEPEQTSATVEGHTLSVRVRDLRSREIRLVVGAGEWDPQAQTWVSQSGAGGPVLDLALSCPTQLRAEITTPARDDAACEWGQAADLAAAETTESFFTVDLDLFGETVPVEPPEQGYVSYVFRSGFDNGDGFWRYDTPAPTGAILLDANPQFLGPWQAFTVALPDGWKERSNSSVVFLHGGGAWGTLPAAFDGFDSEVAAAGHISIIPYGRGVANWWYPAGEADVFEAMAAAEELFPIDPNRRVLSGISMGGYGTYLIGDTHPDLWSGKAVWMAVTSNQVATQQSDPALPTFSTDPLVPNGFNTPMLMLAGTEQTYADMEKRRDQLAQAELEHTYILFGEPGHSHSFVFASMPHLVEWLGGLGPRVSHPRVIQYTFVPSYFEEVPDDPYRSSGGLLKHGRAWWIDDVEVREGESQATIRAVDERVGWDADRTAEPFGPEQMAEAAKPTPLYRQGVRVSHGGQPTGTSVLLDLQGVASLTLDLDMLALPVGASVEVTSDGPVVLSTVGALLCPEGVCQVPAGETVLRVLAPGGSGPDGSGQAGPEPSSPTLPATGGGAATAGLALALGAELIRRRCSRPAGD